MKGDSVPGPDHILRYVGGRNIERDEINGAAFLCKSGEQSPSVNWLEFFDGDIENRVDQVRKRSRLNYGATACLARINVGQVRYHLAERSDDHLCIDVVQDPLEADDQWPDDPSHALMRGTPKIDDPRAEMIGDLIAQCVIDRFPARS